MKMLSMFVVVMMAAFNVFSAGDTPIANLRLTTPANGSGFAITNVSYIVVSNVVVSTMTMDGQTVTNYSQIGGTLILNTWTNDAGNVTSQKVVTAGVTNINYYGAGTGSAGGITNGQTGPLTLGGVELDSGSLTTSNMTAYAVNSRRYGPYAGTNVTGTGWVALGESAGVSALGDSWSALGRNAGRGTTGTFWNAVGNYAGQYGVGNYNLYLGSWAGKNANENEAIFIDTYAVDPGTSYNPSNSMLFLKGGADGIANIGRTNGTVNLRGNAFYKDSEVVNLATLHSNVANEITVDVSGYGQFTSITQALAYVDQIHATNATLYVNLHIVAGRYNENPVFKGYTVLRGDFRRTRIYGNTTITGGPTFFDGFDFRTTDGSTPLTVDGLTLKSVLGNCYILNSFNKDSPSYGIVMTNSVDYLQINNTEVYTRNSSDTANAKAICIMASSGGFELVNLRLKTSSSPAYDNEYLGWFFGTAAIQVENCEYQVLHDHYGNVYLGDVTTGFEWMDSSAENNEYLGNFLNIYGDGAGNARFYGKEVGSMKVHGSILYSAGNTNIGLNVFSDGTNTFQTDVNNVTGMVLTTANGGVTNGQSGPITVDHTTIFNNQTVDAYYMKARYAIEDINISSIAPIAGQGNAVFFRGYRDDWSENIIRMVLRGNGNIEIPNGNLTVVKTNNSDVVVARTAMVVTNDFRVLNSDGSVLFQPTHSASPAINNFQLGTGGGLGWAALGGTSYNDPIARLDLSAGHIFLNGTLFPQGDIYLTSPNYCRSSGLYFYAYSSEISDFQRVGFSALGGLPTRGQTYGLGLYPSATTWGRAEAVFFAGDYRTGFGTQTPEATVDLYPKRVIQQAQFFGTGLNDLNQYYLTLNPYIGTNNLSVIVMVDGNGTPDTYKWSVDGGSTWVQTLVPMTASDNIITNNINIRFNATTGHTIGDYWLFDALYPDPQIWRTPTGVRSAWMTAYGDLLFNEGSSTNEVVTSPIGDNQVAEIWKGSNTEFNALQEVKPKTIYVVGNDQTVFDTKGIYNKVETYNVLLDPVETEIVLVESKSVYDVNVYTNAVITFNSENLNFSEKEVEFKLVLNITETNIPSLTFGTGIQFVQTPEYTVTGRYENVVSTRDGTNYLVRQTYPTINAWTDMSMMNMEAREDAEAHWYITPKPDRFYFVTTVVRNVADGRDYEIYVPAYCTAAYVPDTFVIKQFGNHSGARVSKVSCNIMYQYTTADLYAGGANSHEFPVRKVGTIDTDGHIVHQWRRFANELEVKAYEAGWRP